LGPAGVWGTGDDVRDAIYVDDMVEAIVLGLKKLDKHVAMNVGLGKTYSVKQMLAMILELDGFKDAKVTFNTSKPTMIPTRAVDTSRGRKC
jgi:nucleoside-diphosphate-sugar epimerase